MKRGLIEILPLKTLNKIIQPEYEIRLFMESLGSDTLAFVPLSKEEWEELEKEFGEEKVNYYFFSKLFF